MFRHTLTGVAIDLGVDPVDVLTVATAELTPAEFDDNTDMVTDAGRAALLAHFSGGTDPQ